MGRWTAVLLVGLAAMVAAGDARAVLLMRPDGTPVGGRWQRWADEAKVPTFRGQVTLLNPSVCGDGIAGCSGGPPWYGSHYFIAANGRDALYFELGHLFDWRYLTGPTRARLEHAWRVTGTPWLDSATSIIHGDEDGLEIDFAAAYDECAWGHSLSGVHLAAGSAPTIYAAATCSFVTRIRRR